MSFEDPSAVAEKPSSSHSSFPPMLNALRLSLGNDLLERIQLSRVLVVGAGGIGCELVKNLALSGFRHVEVIDLDTIDVSNLNRQLLFRSHHVGHPKCTVACQVAVDRLVPREGDDGDGVGGGEKQQTQHYRYEAHHGNVCDNSLFHVEFVSQFDLVLNALDNVAARRRVNRLCLAAREGQGVPMIEAGTTGYLGQVSVVQRDEVQCYECRPQEAPKVFPICTIRSTPSAPVHTIVWAKECYKLLFHPNAEESLLYEGDGNDDGGDDGEENGGSGEPSVYMDAVLSYRNFRVAQQAAATLSEEETPSPKATSPPTPDVETLARKVVESLYADEIQKQLNMDRYKAARKVPVPLDAAAMQGARRSSAPTSSSSSWSTTQIWSASQCASELVACLSEAAAAGVTAGVAPEFDKDDELAMRFVTAASNLRNYVFGIEPLQSYYSAKGIAGNIIPAIATTNAIVAGLQILQAFHILRVQLEREQCNGAGGDSSNLRLTNACRYINCVRQPSRNGLYLIASKLEPPNPECFVCRNATVHVSLDVNRWTLRDLLDRVLKSELGFVEPALLLEGNAVWEEGDDDGEDNDCYKPNLDKLLPALPCGGIQHGTAVLVEDYSQDLSVELVVSHCDHWPPAEGGDGAAAEDGDDPLRFRVGGSKAVVPSSSRPAATSAAATTTDGDLAQIQAADGGADDDDIVEVVDEHADAKKRASDTAAELDVKPPAKKRARVAVPVDFEVIEIDDD